jgi:hypothetical protein
VAFSSKALLSTHARIKLIFFEDILWDGGFLKASTLAPYVSIFPSQA